MKLAFDRARFSAAGLDTLPPKDGVLTIILPDHQDMAKVFIAEGVIDLQPHKSSTHKLVLQALGLPG